MAAAKRAREGEDLSSRPSIDTLRLYVQRWHSDVLPAAADHNFHRGSPATRLHATPGPLQRGPVPYLIRPAEHRAQLQRTQQQTRLTIANGSTPPIGTGFAYHPDTLLHERVGAREVERPDRVGKTFEHLSALGLVSLCTPIECKRATTKQLARVHTDRHIDTVDQWGYAMEISGEQAVVVGGDLYACAETSRAARLAAGGVAEAALAVARGQVQNAFALVRPPGHHCSSTSPAGFCFFNNVAVAVRAAQHEIEQQRHAASGDTRKPKILIVDWDVHHCDGTEEVFYNDPSVCVFSIHQYGSKPQHTLRRRHQPRVSSSKRFLNGVTEPESPQSPTPPPAEDITLDELITGIDDDDLFATSDPAAEVGTTTLPQVVTEATALPPQSDEDGQEKRSMRRRGTVDFKALNAAIHDNEATAFFASAGLLREGEHKASNVSSSSSSASIGTRDSDDETSSSFDDDGDSSAPANNAHRFDGDVDGETSTEEDVDRQSLFYPGTGHLHRIGGDDDNGDDDDDVSPAAGRNINVPWPTTGFGDLEYLALCEELLVPLATEFQPDMIFVSCGFDCAEGDLLGSMRLTPTGFRMLTKLVSSLCPKVVVALEGGYNVSQIAKSSEGVLRELLTASHAEDTTFSLPPSTMLWDRLQHTIREVRNVQRPYWKRAFHTEQ